jgi:hypothetical protein
VCSACGIPTHVLEVDPAGEIAAPAPAKFAALRNADCRPYLFGTALANGLRAGSGFTVGVLDAAVGIHWSLGLSSVALCLGTLAAGIYALRDRPAAAEALAPMPVTPAPPVPDHRA